MYQAVSLSEGSAPYQRLSWGTYNLVVRLFSIKLRTLHHAVCSPSLGVIERQASSWLGHPLFPRLWSLSANAQVAIGYLLKMPHMTDNHRNGLYTPETSILH